MTPNALTGPRKMACSSLSLLVLTLFTLSSLAVSMDSPSAPSTSKLTISPTTLPAAAQGKFYSSTLSVSGGNAPYRFVMGWTPLPAGLTLSSSGTISGTPTVTGLFKIVLLVTDSSSTRSGGTLTLAVRSASTSSSVGISVSPASASVSSAGTQQFSALVSGTSNTSVTWSTSVGSISSSGLFTAPSVTTNTSATITVTSVADTTKSAKAVVSIAALNLILDFGMIEEGARRGAPKYMEWYSAFGLMVTLVWLYLEMIRLLAKLRSDRR